MDNFFVVISKFYILLFSFFLFGRAFTIIFSKKYLKISADNINVHGISIFTLYPILGFFIFGNLLFIINFFTPLKHNGINLIFIFLIFNIFEKVNFIELRKYFNYSLVSILLLISSYNINFHYDSGLYHLNNQLWLRESNIIQGFSNIYGAFGVSSLYEYISAYLWIDQSLILLHLINILFILTFFIFIFNGLLNSKSELIRSSSFFLLLFSLLDNVGVSGGRNGFFAIQGMGKPDVTIAILFIIASILIFASLFQTSFTRHELFIFSMLSLLIFQLKVSGATIGFVYLLYVINYFKEKSSSNKDEIKIFGFFFISFILWIIKTLIHTGCIIFPLTSTCFTRFNWVNKRYISTIEEISVGYSFSYDFQSSFVEWAINYLNINSNRIIFVNYAVSILILLVVRQLFFKKNNKGALNLKVIGFIIFNIIFYLRFGPDARYLIGIQLFIIAALSFSRIINYSIPNFMLVILIVLSTALIPRLDSYKSFSVFGSVNIYIPPSETKETYSRLSPLDGDQCWINIDCSANKEEYLIDNTKFLKVVTLKNS